MLKLDLNNLFNMVDSIVSKYMIKTWDEGLYNKVYRYNIPFVGVLRYEGTSEIVDINRIKNHNIVDSQDTVIATALQIKNNYVSNRPTMSNYAATVFSYYVDIYQRDLHMNKEIYYKDDLNINDTQLLSVNRTDTTIDILKAFFPDVPDNTILDIDTLYKQVLDYEVKTYIDKNEGSLFITNSEGLYTFISSSNLYKTRYELMVSKRNEEKCFDQLVSEQTPKSQTVFYRYPTSVDNFIDRIKQYKDCVLLFKDEEDRITYIKGILFITDYSNVQKMTSNNKEVINAMERINKKLKG